MVDEIEVLADIARVNAVRHGSHDAVVHGQRRLTWSQLDARVVRMGNALDGALGIGPGDRISIIAENCLEYYELFHATAVAGVIAVPLNQRLAHGELLNIAERVAPRAIFHDAAHREAAGALAETVGARLVAIGEASAAGTRYDDLLASASDARRIWRPEPGDAATICFTGGTTGMPKGCIIGHGALVENGSVVRTAHGVHSLDRHLFVRPMAVAPGHRMIAWHGCSGGATIIADRFEPGSFYRLVEEERANATLLSPTMFQMLLDHGNPEQRDVSSLRAVAYGGAPITPDLLARVLEVFACGLHQNYGGSEAAIATHLTPEDHLAGRLDSIGRPAPGVDVRLVDPDGDDVGVDEPGEILVRSGQIFSGYWNDEAATSAALRDGFYWTGDLAVRDAEGYLRLVGRNKDLIISGGFNVYPIEVENVLADHPAVREVAVIGVPHERWGEAVHAVVVLHPDATATVEELTAFCRHRIASYKKPQSIEFVAALPRTTVGKIAKNVLRDQFLDHR
jgi:long-chain acyl-CoA synthetase